ncbi:CDP-diacylglycerol--glycerol-3-phosphate 3-phosphatidyltransferase [Sphingomonas sp.]|uniref:CDP-diacylglycerol--glycerol-3-phosphate 3-phosphatidyltransferase n=1 Tax=Sphingomonas sp. TaxID=28214 RepID=UPI001D7CD4E1|nr:CDP-diacylglycerol--glycerol-3-phosphate 3-phosphatidyltransferase [Sphingomonas sp.]MBX9795791.1 CDP-diacylglycerol--glycerol-3-phosphate 3-phosphatidyltransferase [Sphingomonas sp.]
MLSLPNLLTLSRILAVPLLAWLLWWPGWIAGYGLAFLLYTLMGYTDYLDGKLARQRGTVSKLGTFLDPIADKILVAATLLILVGAGRIIGVDVVAALAITIREIAVSGLREFLGGLGVSLPVTRLAKWKTTLQLVALGAIILAGAVPAWRALDLLGSALLWAAAVVTLITGYDYLRAGLRHIDS